MSDCALTKRQIPELKINKEIAEEIGRDYRTLPLFEKGMFKHKHIYHYSLQTNKYLACRLKEYINNYEHRVFTTFQFGDKRDFHFHNGATRLIPSESIHKNTDFRHKLRPGPGVDFKGQLPIPNELIMKRSRGHLDHNRCIERKKRFKDKKIAEEIGRDYRTLPLFEKGMFKHKHIYHYSLQTNKYLACRLKEYINNYEHRVFTTFQFGDKRDFHFHNGATRLIPSESIHKNTDFRHKLRPGPGVDFKGQLPIPNELIMKRSRGHLDHNRCIERKKRFKDKSG